MKKIKSKHKQLPAQNLADFYFQLGRLEESGLPIQETMKMLMPAEDKMAKRVKVALNYLERGKPLYEAGARAGLFASLDIALIQAAEVGGTLAEVFRQLAQFYEEKARQARQIKSRLFLPIVVFIMAIFIQSFPALFLGEITLANYLGATVGFILQLALLIFVFIRLPRWFRYGFLQAFSGLWDKIEMKAPYFGRWFVRRSVRDFMRSLGLMLQAGVPIFEALPLAEAAIENAILRKELQKINLRLQKGDSLADALSQVNVLSPVATQLLLTGETSGNLDKMILHYAKLESEDIAMHNKTLVEWIPRIIYACIAIWMIYGILSTGLPMPEL